MGLIAAGLGAVNNTLRDQWKEFFVCESIPQDVLVVKGTKRTGRGSSNNGNDNVITNGSGIVVADGQCMIIVEQGKVVEVCAEPGEFTYDNTVAPSIFTGKLGDSIKETFAAIGKAFTYGGTVAVDQRVYYFNTKELMDNKFGTANPIMFRAVDKKIGLDMDVDLRCSGTYSYRIADPLLFYTNVCGNVESTYTRDLIESQMKAEFVSALQPAFGKLAALELRPSEVPNHNDDLEKFLNESLSEEWRKVRGIEVCNVAVSTVTLTEEDAAAIKQLQKYATLSNPAMAAGYSVGGNTDASLAAANNTAGAVTGFMGMGMAQNQGSKVDATALYQMAAQQNAAAQQPAAPATQPAAPAAAPMAAPVAAPAADSWVCPTCGQTVTGNFCANCGAKKPSTDWTCPSCGTVNSGNFCTNCGTKKA